jgi:hypothetical protein
MGVSTSSTATFDTMVANIKKIDTGKKWATGSIYPSGNYYSSTSYYKYITLTSLNFKPRMFIVISIDSTYATVYCTNSFTDPSLSSATSLRGRLGGQSNSSSVKYFQILSNGFKIAGQVNEPDDGKEIFYYFAME